MASIATANAINEVAQRMGVIGIGISSVFVAALYLARTAARRRLILRLLMAILFVNFLCFLPSFMRAGYRAIDIAFMLGAVTLIFGVSLRFTTFCDACNRAITNNRPWMRIRNCPHCGAELPRPL